MSFYFVELFLIVMLIGTALDKKISYVRLFYLAAISGFTVLM